MKDVFITAVAARHPAGDFGRVEAALGAGSPATGPVARLAEPAGAVRNWDGLAYTDRISRLVASTASHVLEGKAYPSGAGMALGTFYGSQRINEEMLETVGTAGPGALSANDFAIDTFNSPGSLAAIKLGLLGPNSTFLTLTGALDSIAWAHEQIAAGRAGMMLAGGYDEVTPFLEHLLSPTIPTLAEGVCIMLLEDKASIDSGGRQALAVIRGYGSASARDRTGCVAAMSAALREAGLGSADIDVVITASSAASDDDREAQAVAEFFAGSAPTRLDTKACIGHSLGAAGAFDVAYAASLCRNAKAANVLINTQGLGSGFASLVVGAA